MIVITGDKVKAANVLVDRLAKLTAAHYLSDVEYELSKRTEQQIRCTLMRLYHEAKYWEAVGILMEIFKEFEDECAQDLLVVLNAEITEANAYLLDMMRPEILLMHFIEQPTVTDSWGMPQVPIRDMPSGSTVVAAHSVYSRVP